MLCVKDKIYMYTIRVKQPQTFFSADTFDGSSWGVSLFSVCDGKATTTYDYTIAGQLVSATTGNKTESFLWDGLALIRRGGVNYLNEPHAGGGAALLAGGKVMFNDVLGTTLGVESEGGTFSTASGSAYGEADSTDHLFTGKPYVEGLGHAFLLRNYRADLGEQKSAKGKHLRSPTAILKPMCDSTHVGARIGIPRRSGNGQTADPLGHPDGWNNFAYCNGQVTSAVDWIGALSISCFDANNNNSYIWGASSITLGNAGKTGGGSFSVNSVNVSYINGTVQIQLQLDAKIDKSVPRENLMHGLIVGYRPHGLYLRSACYNPFIELLGAHERGHVAAFFQMTLSFLRIELTGIDQLAAQLTQSELNDRVEKALKKVDAAADGWDFSAANTATYNVFDSSWIELPSENGYRRWYRE